jgi:hypothetical protein
MTEFADIFAYIYVAGSISVLVAAAIAALWIGREPGSEHAFVPAYGL